jgi:hypothetical protein
MGPRWPACALLGRWLQALADARPRRGARRWPACALADARPPPYGSRTTLTGSGEWGSWAMSISSIAPRPEVTW